MRDKRHTLKLDEARTLTPPVSPIEAMRRQLAVAVYGAVKESDVEEMVGKLKALALQGDHKAMKMYFELIGVMGKQQVPADGRRGRPQPAGRGDPGPGRRDPHQQGPAWGSKRQTANPHQRRRGG